MARPTPPPRELIYLPLSQVSEDTTYRLRHAGDVSSLARSIAQAGQLFPIEVRRAGERYQPITGFRRLSALRLLHRDRVLVRIHENLGDDAAALLAAADAIDNRPLEREELLEMRDRYRGMGWSTPAFEELINRAIEKAEERLEDLAAQLQGQAPPDRTVADEDALVDEGIHGAAAAPAPAPVPAENGAKTPVEPPPTPQVAPPAQPLAETPRPTTRHIPTEVVQPPEEPPGPVPLGKPRTAVSAPTLLPREVTAPELAEDVARRLSALTQDLAALAGAWDQVPPELHGILADQLHYYRQLGAWIDQASGEYK